MYLERSFRVAISVPWSGSTRVRRLTVFTKISAATASHLGWMLSARCALVISNRFVLIMVLFFKLFRFRLFHLFAVLLTTFFALRWNKLVIHPFYKAMQCQWFERFSIFSLCMFVIDNKPIATWDVLCMLSSWLFYTTFAIAVHSSWKGCS